MYMEFRKMEMTNPICKIPPLLQSFLGTLGLVLCSLELFHVNQHIPQNLAHKE